MRAVLAPQSLPDFFQSDSRNLQIAPIRFPAVLLKAVQNVDGIADLSQVNKAIPRSVIAVFQFPNTLPHRCHRTMSTPGTIPVLKLAQ
jgi:hypothetical protein